MQIKEEWESSKAGLIEETQAKVCELRALQLAIKLWSAEENPAPYSC